MSYKSESIATAVSRMNRQYFLPAIQREFVWKPEQIIQLFDSILRGYPISSFLFWELKPENRDKWQLYKFLEKAREGGTHNELTKADGSSNIFLILDGQQRLTSLSIGLRGAYEAKKKHKRSNNPDAWTVNRLHLDLLSEPHLQDDDAESGLYYQLAFLASQPEPGNDHYWFRLGRILDFDEEQKFDTFLEQELDTLHNMGCLRTDQRNFERNLKRLYNAVHHDQVIAYFTEADQNYDRVLDIFVRANEGGTKLSKSDLLLSMATKSWNGVDAREEIYGFVDHLNTELMLRNRFDKDFVMKSCLVLTDLPIMYKVENFSPANLSLIENHWEQIRSAVERAVDLTNSFGIYRDNLTSTNAIIPIAYYLFKNPRFSFRGSTPFEARNTYAIRQWLIGVLLKGAFGRASDGLLRDIRSNINLLTESGSDFPVEAINGTIARTGLARGFDEVAIGDVLSLAYKGQQTFLALSLLYDNASWGTTLPHEDHIFPSASFKPKDLAATGRSDWLTKKNQLGNLCLLLGSENMGKSDMLPNEWLPSRDPDFLRRHLIPNDPSLWTLERFEDFLAARNDLIRTRLRSLFVAVA